MLLYYNHISLCYCHLLKHLVHLYTSSIYMVFHCQNAWVQGYIKVLSAYYVHVPICYHFDLLWYHVDISFS